MKLKLKVSKEGIKRLALAHGEKALFGLGVLIFLIFVYAFFGRVTLPPDKAPDVLKRKASEAQEYMAQQQWDPKREQLAITDYVKRAKRDPLEPGEYALKTPFDMPPRPQMSKRADPVLLAVESLQATGAMAPFELKRAGAVEVRGQRYALVTGLVPVKKQAASYDDAFRDAIPVVETAHGGGGDRSAGDSKRDTPVYKFQPIVERAEVVTGKETGKDLHWDRVDMKKIVTMKEEWSNKPSEIVSARYVDPVYTKDLGPLASGDWDEKAAHPPEIPLATVTELEEAKVRIAAEQEAHEQALKDKAAGIDTKNAAKRGLPGEGAAQPGSGKPPAKAVDYRLFRFIDPTVEPNKRYRYRVGLILANPNFDLPEKFLKNPASRSVEYLQTPMSEASPIVDIPRGEGILAGPPKPPARPGYPGEPVATLLFYTIEPTTGLEAVAERQVHRGSVLNFSSRVEVFNPVTKKPEELDVTFNTNSMVLDIRGGREFKGMVRDRIMEPSEVLLWSSASRLMVHSELDEVEQFGKHASASGLTEEPEKEKASAAGARPKKAAKSAGEDSNNLLDAPVRSPTTGSKK